MKALVVGGAGPTGPLLVAGLQARGYDCAVLNRGVHPVDLPDNVERIVGDPHFLETMQAALGDRSFDVVIASYGRLAVLAEAFAGKAGRFIGIGGFVPYRGFLDPLANVPRGLPVPTPEHWPLERDFDAHRFSALVSVAEDAVFRHHPTGTVFRYPNIYGPRQLVPREWSMVRRVLDQRPAVVLSDSGLGLLMHGYADNVAHAVLLAVDKPEASGGKAYNVGDEAQLSVRQFVEVVLDEMGSDMEIVSLPFSEKIRMTSPGGSLDHRVLDLSQLRADLGYADLVPAVEALRRTVRYYVEHPLERGGEIEKKMMDCFDYEAEDQMIALAREVRDRMDAIEVKGRAFIHPYAHPKAPGEGRDEKGR